jgi:hypothetical protein
MPISGTCTTSNDCEGDNDICAIIKPNVGVCKKKCTYTVSANGEYSDDASLSETCQPIGDSLTAIKAGTKQVGEACDIANACAKGLVCIKGNVCHKLCTKDGDNSLGCADGKECKAADVYNFCAL